MWFWLRRCLYFLYKALDMNGNEVTYNFKRSLSSCFLRRQIKREDLSVIKNTMLIKEFFLIF